MSVLRGLVTPHSVFLVSSTTSPSQLRSGKPGLWQVQVSRLLRSPAPAPRWPWPRLGLAHCSPWAGRRWTPSSLPWSHTHSGQHLPGTSTLLGFGQSQLGSRMSSLHSGTQVKPPSSHWQRILQWGWKVSPSRYRRPFTSQLPSSSPPAEEKPDPHSGPPTFPWARPCQPHPAHGVSAELAQILLGTRALRHLCTAKGLQPAIGTPSLLPGCRGIRGKTVWRTTSWHRNCGDTGLVGAPTLLFISYGAWPSDFTSCLSFLICKMGYNGTYFTGLW